MDLDDIDELLGRYTAAESRIVANLVELDAHPTFELLTDADLAGETQRRLGQVMASAPAVWEGLRLLQDILTTARELRASGRMNSERRTELAELLTGPSVLIDRRQTPLGERDLLGTGIVEEHVTIEQLLDRMRAGYEPLRDGVAAVDAIWRDLLPRLDAADATVAQLGTDAAALGVTEPLVSVAARAVDRFRSLVFDDPLALGPDPGTELDEAVAAAAKQMGRLQAGHDQLAGDLADAPAMLAELRMLRAQAAAAASEARVKVTPTTELVQVPDAAAIDGDNGLVARLAEIRAHRGPWTDRRQRLDAWQATAERMRSQLRRANDRNQGPLRRRDELRGLLRAYRSKAAAQGRAEDAVTLELFDEAHNELYTAPTDLPRAQHLMDRVAHELQNRPLGAST